MEVDLAREELLGQTRWKGSMLLVGWMSIAVWILCGVVSPLRLIAQTPGVSDASASFDVASVRLNKVEGPSRTSEYHDGDTWKLNYSDTPLLYFLQKAYGVKDYQILGPDLIRSRSYDIVATGLYKPDDQYGWQPMLRNLLAARFQLKLHRETRSLPAYELVVGQKGPKLKVAKRRDGYSISGQSGREVFEGVSMANLAGSLTRITGLPVVDKTGLAGRYDFTLEYSRESQSVVPESSEGPGAIDTSSPSILTALQEQLGLKLKAVKGPVEVLVIDHVEQPSEN